MIAQQTLKTSISCQGVGLHGGVECVLTLKPAAADHGIVFKRTDISDKNPLVPARWDMVHDTTLCTRLQNSDGVAVSTVEHMMAALAGSQIDNALIEIDGPEVPIMDGSSKPFVQMIDRAGTAPIAAPRRAIRVLKPVSAQDHNCRIEITPDDHFSVKFEIDYNSAAITEKSLDVKLVNGTFNNTISGARTFGFMQDIDRLRAAGLGRGGNLDNVVVVDGDRILNEGGLRFKDEFVRHKILDCIGDLYLAGAPILGRVTASKSGHLFNNTLLRTLFADKTAWERVEMPPEMAAADHDHPLLAATA